MFLLSLKTGTMKSTVSDGTDGHPFSNPGHDLVESFFDAGGRFEVQDPFRLLGARNPSLHVVAERFVGNVPERITRPDFLPDQLGELQHRHRLRGREIEIFVERLGRFDRQADSSSEVAAICVMPHLVAIAQDVQRILTLENSLHEIGHDVTHREANIAGRQSAFDDRVRLANADAVERTHNRERPAVLFPGALREVLRREILKFVCRYRMWKWPLLLYVGS